MAVQSVQGGGAMDWPLSREEKKSQLLRFYHTDMRIADSLIVSGEATLKALHKELDDIRRTSPVAQQSLRVDDTHQSSKEQDAETARLRQAVESATAVLRALLPTTEEEGKCDLNDIVDRSSQKCRAKSEGAAPSFDVPTKPGALCRTPRSSTDRRRRRVSFGGESPGETSEGNEAMQSARCRTDMQQYHAHRGNILRRRHSNPASTNTQNSMRTVSSAADYTVPVGFSSISEILGRWWGSELDGGTERRHQQRVCTPPRMKRVGSPEPISEPGPEPEVGGDNCTSVYCVTAGVDVAQLGVRFRGQLPDPVVVSRVEQSSWAISEGVSAGDVLEAVSGSSLHEITDDAFCALMKLRPLTLRFSRSEARVHEHCTD